MQKVSVTGVGVSAEVDIQHTDAIAIQTHGDGATTYQVEARVSPEAPWATVIASSTVDHIQSLPFYPELRLNVTAGAGTVTLYASYGLTC
jgi:hypothetical protein